MSARRKPLTTATLAAQLAAVRQPLETPEAEAVSVAHYGRKP